MKIETAIKRTVYLAVFVCVVMFAFTQEAEAISRKSHYVWATTASGASLVGSLSAKLSKACRNQAFNQLREYQLIIQFKGSKDNGISGIATTNWNLYDPGGLAAPRMTFHFFNDGYSNCKVYVSPQDRNRY